MRRVLLTSVLVLASTLLAACLEDLEPAAQCPGEAQREGGNCYPTIEQVSLATEPRCLSADETLCLAGTKACACLSGSCPVQEDACFPPPDCPPEVRQRYPEATCVRLAPEEIGLGLPSEAQCMCGCAGCAAVCDGGGPVLGVLDDTTLGFIPPAFEVRRHLPEQGTFGIYLRLRGLANLGVALVAGTLDPQNGVFEGEYLNLDGAPFLLSPLTSDFVEHVIVDQELLNVPPYTWTSAAGRPDYVLLAPTGKEGEPSLSLYELDCAVPFFLPP